MTYEPDFQKKKKIEGQITIIDHWWMRPLSGKNGQRSKDQKRKTNFLLPVAAGNKNPAATNVSDKLKYARVTV